MECICGQGKDVCVDCMKDYIEELEGRLGAIQGAPRIGLLEILKHIDAEPELPGDPPDEMKALLLSAIIEKDVDILAKALRLTVRLTKEGIAERITSAFTGPGKAPASDA